MNIKALPLITVLSVLIFINRGESQIILNQGESYDFTFSAMNTNTGISFAWPIDVIVSYENDLLETGESIRFELFENNLSDTPWLSTDITPSGPLNQVTSIVYSTDESRWVDLTGAVRITMLAGSAEISGLSIGRNFATDKYYVTASIPEPSTYSLLLLGSIFWILINQKRKWIVTSN
ncbi:MAG: PEP-CTERM sorting domain-containing protein [Candidatus Paceibacterota bacterium]|jgi:hypothetical protein